MEVKTLIIIAIAIAVGLGILGFFFKSGKKEQEEAGYVYKECLSCGWKGKVSKFHKKCPNCADSIV
jgi:hypothetical protein